MQGFFEGFLPDFFKGLLIAAGIGLVLGLEREFNTHAKPAHLGGIRTFVLATLLGYVATWLHGIGYPQLLLLFGIGFFILIVIAYFAQSTMGNLGLTTEIALFLSFAIGAMIAAGYITEAMVLVVMLTLVLSLKEQLHGFIRQLTTEELYAFIKFFVMALLILPLLPDKSFGPGALLNLRELGWIVVLVLSLSFIGYLLLKFGKPDKGIWITAVIGGLFSSTLIAWVFSAKSRENPSLGAVFGSGIVLASAIMFARVLLLAGIFHPPLARLMFWPLFAMFLACLVPTAMIYRSSSKNQADAKLSPGYPLDVANAVWFLLLYVGITYLMFGSRQWLGGSLIYLSGAIAGIADLDAITISTAKWSASQSIINVQAAVIILLAALSNSVFKLGISLSTGAADIRKSVWLGFGLVLLVGLASVLFLLQKAV